MRRTLLTLILFGLLASPLVAAQEDEDDDYTHLYGHMFSIGRTGTGDSGPNAMNTLYPEGENDFSMGYPRGAISMPGTEGTCIMGDLGVLVGVPLGFCDPVTEVEGNEAWFFNYNAKIPYTDWVAYRADGGLELLDADKYILKDIRLDPARDVRSVFYMSADQTPFTQFNKGCAPALILCPVDEFMKRQPMTGDIAGDLLWPFQEALEPVREPIAPFYDDVVWPWPLWNADYGIFPQWTVLSTAYSVSPEFMATHNVTGAPAAIMTATLNETAAPTDPVKIIASGNSVPFDMFSLPSSIPGYHVVYGMEPLMGAPLVDTLPAEDTLWWSVDWYSDMGGDVKVLWGANIAANSGEFFPPSLSLPMLNPMDIEMVMPQFTDDNKLVIIALFNSPFGAYDVPLDSASFEIIAPDGSVIATQDDDTVTWMQKAAREQQSLLGVSPEAALARGQATWLWNYLAEKDIKPGDYTIRVNAENAQGKAAHKEAYFTISEGLGKGGVTSSLGGMFTFSKDDIKELEECHGCHDAATGDLLEGVQNVTMAEAKAMLESGELDTADTDDVAEKKSPGIGLFVTGLALLVFALRRRNLP